MKRVRGRSIIIEEKHRKKEDKKNRKIRIFKKRSNSTKKTAKIKNKHKVKETKSKRFFRFDI